MADCSIRGVRSVELVATNFEEADRFYQQIWNLRPVAARPRKSAHVNLTARDFEGSLRFFIDTLAFRQIDENAPLWFLRCASPDHASIVLAKTNQPTLNHVAFEMPDYDSVMRGIGRMKD